MPRRTYRKSDEVRDFQEEDVAVADADTEVISVPLTGQEQLCFRVANAGDEAITGLEISLTFYDDGESVVVASADEYTTPTWPVVRFSADPTALTAGAEAFGVIDVRGARSFVVSASAATDAPTVLTIEGTAQ